MQDILTVGYNDFALLGDGWHERSVDGRCGVIYRPSMAAADFTLQHVPSHCALTLLVAASPSLVGGPVTVRISTSTWDGLEVSLENDDWQLVNVPLPERSEGRTKFLLQVNPVYIPHAVLGNGDVRELGVYLAAARLIKEETSRTVP